MADKNWLDEYVNNLEDEQERDMENKNNAFEESINQDGSEEADQSDNHFEKQLRKKINKNKDKDNKESKLFSRFATVLTIVVFAFVLITDCHFTLNEEEYAVVTTFGNPSVVSDAGWKWKVPFIQKVEKLPKSVLAMTIGYEANTGQTITEESTMITSDFNIVDVDFYIEYKVSDPLKASINKEEHYAIIKNLAQSYIRDTVGVNTVDSVITTGKAEIQQKIQDSLKQRIMDEDIGYSIERVSIQDADLPTSDVQEAFRNVENAKQSMVTKQNQAKQYQSEQIPAAEAQADGLIRNAEATKEKRINEAKGQVARFEKTYEEYKKYPLITKKRMFYETMEGVLPSLKVIINSSDGTQTLLPLDAFNTSTQ